MATGSIVDSRRPASAVESPSERYIDRQLRQTQWQIRLFDIGITLALWIAALLVGLLLLAICDHWFVSFGTAGRWLALLCLAGGSLYYLVTQLGPLLVRPINNAYAAKVIEDSQPTLKNSILNFLMLRGSHIGVPTVVVDALRDRAAADLTRAPLDHVIDRAPLLRLGYVVCGIMVVFALYKFISPKDPFRTVARVLAPWADISRPTRVHIVKVTPGDTEVYLGQTVTITADLEGAKERDSVELVYSTADGQTVNAIIAMTSTAGLHFTCQLPANASADDGLQQSVRYRVRAGDADSSDYEIRVLPRPQIEVERVELDFPRYTKRQPQLLAKRGDVRGPEGTRVTVHGKANQLIEAAYIEFDADNTSESRRRNLAQNMKVEGQTAIGEFVLQRAADGSQRYSSYQLRFLNQNGARSDQPTLHRIEITPDLAPEIEVLTPHERKVELPLDRSLEVELRGRDPDFGLCRIAVELTSAGQAANTQVLYERADGSMGPTNVRYTIVPQELNLHPGDELTLVGVAEDNRCNAAGERAANVSRTDRYVIHIAPPEAVESKTARSEDGEQGHEREPAKNSASGNTATTQRPEVARKNGNTPPQSSKTGPSEQQPPKAGEHSSPATKPDKRPEADQPKSNDSKPSPAKSGENQPKPGEKQQPNNAQQQPNEEKPNKEQPNKSQQKSAGEGGGSEKQEGGAKQQQQGGGSAGSEGSESQESSGSEGSEGTPGGAGSEGGSGSSNSSGTEGSESSAGGSSTESTGNSGGAKNSSAGESSNDSSGTAGENSSESSSSPGSPMGNQDANASGSPSGAKQGSGQNATGQSPSGAEAGANSRPKHDGEVIEEALQRMKEKQQSGAPSSGEKSNDASRNSAEAAGAQSGAQQSGAGEGSAAKPSDAKSPGGDNAAGGQTGNKQAGNKHAAGGSKEGGQPSGSEAAGNTPMAQQDATPAENANSPNQQPGNQGDPMPPSKTGGSGEKKPSDATQPGASGNKTDDTGAESAGEKSASPMPSADDAALDKQPGQQEGASTGGQGRQGDAGAGQKSNKPNPSGTADVAAQDTPKSTKPDGGERNGDSPGSPSADKKQSNSQGENSGDQSGGGKQGAGQSAAQKGNDAPGSSSSADAGAGASSEKGNGETGSKAGTDQKAPGTTGQSGSEQGAGNKSQAGTGDKPSPQAGGDQPGGAGQPKSPAAKSGAKADSQTSAGSGAVTGGGMPSTGEVASNPNHKPANVADTEAERLEYARKSTDLALKYLKDQENNPDPELLKRLGWTKDDLEAFLKRWETMKGAAQEDTANRDDLDDAYRSLGLRSPADASRRAATSSDAVRSMRDAGARSEPPPGYAEQFKAFRKGVNRKN